MNSVPAVAVNPIHNASPPLISQPVESHLANALTMLAIPNIRRFLLESSPDPMADAEILDHPMHRKHAYALALHRVVWGVKELESEHRASWLYTPAWAEQNIIAGVAVRHDNSRAAVHLATLLPAYPSGYRMMRFAFDLPQGNLLTISSPCPEGTVELQYIAARLHCTRYCVVAVLRANLLVAAAKDQLDLALLRRANLFTLTLRRRRYCAQCSVNFACRTMPQPPKYKIDFSSFQQCMAALRGVCVADGESHVVAHIETRRVNTTSIRAQLAILQLVHSQSIAALRSWGYKSRPMLLQGPTAALEFRRKIDSESAAQSDAHITTVHAPHVQENHLRPPFTQHQYTSLLNHSGQSDGAHSPMSHIAQAPHDAHKTPPLGSAHNRTAAVAAPSAKPNTAPFATPFPVRTELAIAPAQDVTLRNRFNLGISCVPRIEKNPFAPIPKQSTYISARDKRLEERRERNRRSAAKSNLIKRQHRLELLKEIDEVRKQVRKLEERRDLLVQENYELKAQLLTTMRTAVIHD